MFARGREAAKGTEGCDGWGGGSMVAVRVFVTAAFAISECCD